MRHFMFHSRMAEYLSRIISQFKKLLLQIKQIIRHQKPCITGISARQIEVEKQAQAAKARHGGRAAAAVMPYQLIR